MHFDLSDDEAAELATLLRRLIFDDHYPLSPRVKAWQAILDKIAPPPTREPLPPPPKRYEPPRSSRESRH